ncbi:LysR family transcriptional regulator [Saccharothrix deserti]|uniref:LysR family transcriptional regulator n=1 Tax=Saccharothrix deserti TaxID=2593674 RepID=UPI00131BF31E|nr:LysR family transcriptional regulator [Saccharothrix deserti]
MADFTLTGLRVLREVAAQGSFTGAAERLGYTQSAISRQIAALEAAAGTQLFERTARGVRLAEAGHVLLRHADAVLDRVDAARRDLDNLRGQVAGRLRVGAFPTAMAALLPQAISRSRQIGVTLREGTTPAQLRRVRAGTLGLAVVGGVTEDPDLHLDPLPPDPLLLAVARDHPLAGARAVAFEELAGETWIAGSANPGETFLAPWRPRVGFVVREWTAKLGLVAAGLGVTLVPGLAATSIRADIALIRISDPEATRAVALATRDRTATTKAFADVVQDVAADLAVALRHRLRDR